MTSFTKHVGISPASFALLDKLNRTAFTGKTRIDYMKGIINTYGQFGIELVPFRRIGVFDSGPFSIRSRAYSKTGTSPLKGRSRHPKSPLPIKNHFQIVISRILRRFDFIEA
jgi:hypothetical protein